MYQILLLLIIAPLVRDSTAIRDDTTDPTSVHPRVKIICDKIDHLKKDFRAYIKLYKDMVKKLNSNKRTKGKNTCRKELEEMFDMIKCILELIRDMEKKKNNGEIQPNTDFLIECLEKWITMLLQKVGKLGQIYWRLVQCFNKVQGTKDFLDRLEILNRQCLDVAQDDLQEVLMQEVDSALERAAQSELRNVGSGSSILPWGPPIPEMCQKYRELLQLCRELYTAFVRIRKLLLGSGFDNRFYPYEAMGQLWECIIEYCRCLKELRDICRRAQRMSAKDLEKALCEFIMKLQDIRFKIREYVEDLCDAIDEMIKRMKDEDSSQADTLEQLGQRVKRQVKNVFVGLLVKLENCIYKMECLYLNMVLAQGPKRVQIAVSDPNDRAV